MEEGRSAAQTLGTAISCTLLRACTNRDMLLHTQPSPGIEKRGSCGLRLAPKSRFLAIRALLTPAVGKCTRAFGIKRHDVDWSVPGGQGRVVRR